MRVRVILLAGAALLWSTGAEAASLCSCCGDKTVANCSAACVAVKPPPGRCIASVDYDGKADIRREVNPLYDDLALRNIALGTPSSSQLERFRQLMERSRRGVERDRRTAFRAFRRGRIDADTMSRREKRYEDALVNYYLGMKAYGEVKVLPKETP